MSQKNYTPVIGPILASIMVWAGNFADTFIQRIKDVFLKSQVERIQHIYLESIKALSDTNPEDSDQIQAIVFDVIKETAFQDEVRERLMRNLNESSDNEALKEVVKFLIDNGFDVTEILLNSNPDNEAELIDALAGSIDDARLAAFVVNILQTFRPDITDAQAEPLVQLLLQILRDQISSTADNPIGPASVRNSRYL